MPTIRRSEPGLRQRPEPSARCRKSSRRTGLFCPRAMSRFVAFCKGIWFRSQTCAHRFACGHGLVLDFLLRTLFAPPFRIWPTPEPGSWQSLTFWGLFRGGMVPTFAVAALDWNATPLLDWTRYIAGGAARADRPRHHRLRLFQSRPRQHLLRQGRPRDRRPLPLQPQPAIHRLDHRPDRLVRSAPTRSSPSPSSR